MYEELIGKEICGCKVLEILPSENGHIMAMIDTHCVKCGLKKVRIIDLLKRRKYACRHSTDLSENKARAMRQTCERKMREYAENCIGKDFGSFHVDCIVEEPPFTKRPLRTYIRVICKECGNSQIVDANRVCKIKCGSCLHHKPHDGLTAKYPRLYNSLKRHWQKCYSPDCDGYYMCGGKGWHFDSRWIHYENGKLMLNTKVAIEDCIELGWDENNNRMILEKDKLAKEIGERVIGKQTIRCVDRKENARYHFDE